MALAFDPDRTSTQSAGDPVTEWDAMQARVTAKLAGRAPLATHPLVEPEREAVK